MWVLVYNVNNIGYIVNNIGYIVTLGYNINHLD